MKITSIETYVLKVPLGPERFYYSQSVVGERTSLLVRLTTDSGLQGWGECGVSMPVEHLATYIHDVLSKRVLGKDPLATEPLWNELYAYSRDYGRKSSPIDAMSGIDVAMWDIKGRHFGVPVSTLIGGACRDRVRSYATGLYYRGEDVQNIDSAISILRDEAQRYLDMGFTAIKGKVGLLSVRDDIRRMEVLREVVGDEFLLMTDANHAYNRHSARRMGEALSALDFFWFEEPVVPEDIHGCAELRRQLKVPIATGETEYTRYGFHELLKADAADILQPDISACGGISEGLKIYALASAYNTPLCLHVWGSGVAIAAALQLTAILAPTPHTVFPRTPENDVMFEYDRNPNPLRDDLLVENFKLDGEVLRIPQGPGLGIQINEDVLKRYTVAKRESRV